MKIKNSKRKLITAIVSLCVVIVSFSVILIGVFAASQQTLNNRVSVMYETHEVAGIMTASYTIQGEEERNMVTEDGKTQIVFTGVEKNDKQNAGLYPETDIELTSDKPSVVFKYSFTNAGDADYIAKLKQTAKLENLKMEISKNGIDYTDIDDLFMLVERNTATPTNYYVRISIIETSRNVSQDIKFNWTLVNVSADAVAIVDGEEVRSVNVLESIISTNINVAEVSMVSSVADNAIVDNLQIVSLIKDINFADTIKLAKNTLIYAEKNVVVSNLSLTDVFDLSQKTLMIGQFYDRANLSIYVSDDKVACKGSGNLILNNGLINGTSKETGKAISLDSGSSAVINGGTISNFKTIFDISLGSGLKVNGGNFENFNNKIETSGDTSGKFIVSGDLYLEDMTFTKPVEVKNAEVTLKNCVFDGENIAIVGDIINVSSNSILNLLSCDVKNWIKDSSRESVIYNSGTVVIQGGNYTGNTMKRGGVVYNKGSVTINDAIFSGNKADEGGVVFAETGDVSINNSIITSNEATYGGVVYALGNVNISECVITGGSKLAEHGGLFYLSSGDKKITIKNSTLKDAMANYGGAIFSYAEIEIIGGKIENCYCNGNLGGVIWSNKTVTISGGEFDGGNTAEKSIINAGGGGLIYSSSPVTIKNNAIIKNFKSSSMGGAIRSDNLVTVSDSTFDNCVSDSGGAVYSHGVIGNNLTINNCTARDGGALFNSGIQTEISITNSQILNCKATSAGGIICSSNDVRISGGLYDGGYDKLSNNISNAQDGGFICITSSALVTIKDATIKNFKSLNNGGAIYAGSTVSITNSTIENCCSKKGGATFCRKLESQNLIISNCEADNGGAIYATGQICLKGGLISNCSSVKDGGAIYCAGLLTNNLNIKNCFSSGNGGSIFASGNVNIIDSILENSSSTGNGGLILASGNVNIIDSTLENSSSLGNGGAIYLVGDANKIELTDSILLGLTAEYGGAIFSEGEVFSVGGMVRNCKSNGNRGGVIYSNEDVSISGGEFDGGNTTENEFVSAGAGGLVFVVESVIVSNNATIKNYKTTSMGGAICSGVTTIIADSTITNCISSSGGAIFATNIELYNSTISECVATANGGAIYGNYFVMDGGTITNCSATECGGAISVEGKIYLSGQVISGCSARFGGAIYQNGNHSESVIAGEFVNNIAIENGGAIASEGLGGITINADFRGDKTTVNALFGGAVYILNDVNATITGGTYTNLVSASAGGAITNLGTLTISGSEETVVFDGCKSRIGGAVANSVYNASDSSWSVDLEGATLIMKNTEFKNNTATEGESHAIINIGRLILNGENSFAEGNDIGLAKITVMAIYTNSGTIEVSEITEHTNKLYISTSTASLGDSNILDGIDFSTITIQINGTYNPTIPTGITYDPAEKVS